MWSGREVPRTQSRGADTTDTSHPHSRPTIPGRGARCLPWAGRQQLRRVGVKGRNSEIFPGRIMGHQLFPPAAASPACHAPPPAHQDQRKESACPGRSHPKPQFPGPVLSYLVPQSLLKTSYTSFHAVSFSRERSRLRQPPKHMLSPTHGCFLIPRSRSHHSLGKAVLISAPSPTASQGGISS